MIPDVQSGASQLGVFLHGTQALAGLLVAGLLAYLWRVHHRRFLLCWSLSWAALALFHLAATSGSELARLPLSDPLRSASVALSLTAAYSQAGWLLAGVWSLGTRRTISARVLGALVGVPVLLGLATVLASPRLGPEARVFLRTGLTGLVLGLGYLGAAVALARTTRREPGAARWLVAILFALLAANEGGRLLIQLVVGQEGAPGALSSVVTPHFLALALHLLLLSGLLFWSFEEERKDLLRTTRALTESEERRLRAEHMEAVGRLAGRLAHDFNNMLTAITGRTELILGRKDLGPREREDVLPIAHAAARAAELVRELLTFSRRQPLAPRPFVLDELLGEMRSMLASVVGPDVHVELALRAPGAVLRADPGQIEMAILNLATNARDAMEGRGRLLLSTALVAPATREGARRLRLDVVDEGCGIAPEQLARIFEPYFTTKAARGTGLGLASVQAIVEQNGGTIEVESEPGRGTTFHLGFPLEADAPERPVELVPFAPRAGGPRRPQELGPRLSR